MKRIILLLVVVFSLAGLNAQRKMENLGRGTVAVRNGSSTFVSWRIKADEFNNGTTYNLYRDNSLVASGLSVSNYSDTYSSGSKYSVAAVVDGVEQPQSLQVGIESSQIITVPLNNIGSYHIPMVWSGDLDGDSEYEFVVVRIPNDASQTIKLEAYDVDGSRFWQIDLGPLSINRDNIEGDAAVLCNGMWDGVTVYDLDMDGKSEVILKTANGTVLGDGTKVTFSNNIQNFISVLNGQTGAEISRVALPDIFISDGPLQSQLAIAYLDGINPSVIAKAKNRKDNGWFNRLIAAYDYSSGTISEQWLWTDPGNCPEFHQLRMVDVDLDGKDEICDGGTVVNEDGSLLYSLGPLGVVHGDRFHIGDLDPDRPGLEGYGIQQDNANGLAWYYYDASNGELLQTQYQSYIGDYARGNAADLDPNHPGFEMWTFTDGIYNVQDGKITNNITSSYPNFRLWWDGDLQSEMLDGVKFNNWNYVNDYEERILTASDFGATTVTRSAPAMYGDIIGDWREEVVFARNDHNALLIFTTINPTNERIYTLLQNPEYRLCLTAKGYYQSAQLDYFLGYDMSTPPTPAIINAKTVWNGNESLNWNESDNNWLVNGVSGNYSENDTVLFGIIDESHTSVVVNEIIEPAMTFVMSPVDYSFSGTGEISGSGDLVKSGSSLLTMNINGSYSGKTRIEQGTVVVNDTLSNSDVVVFGGATLAGSGVINGNCTFENRSILSPGTQSETATFTLSKSLLLNKGIICEFDITDDSTNMVNPSDKIMVGGDLTIETGVNIIINAFDDEIKPGYYPLIAYSGSITGNLSSIKVDGLFGRKYSLIDTLKTITLKILGTRNASSITWSGLGDTWDLLETPNFLLDNSETTFVSGDTVVFNQQGVANTTVNILGELPVGDLTVDVDKLSYTFAGNGVIGGNGGLTKTGSGGLLMRNGNNTYLGKTVIKEGFLEVTSLNTSGSPSSIGANESNAPSQFVIENARLKYRSSDNSYTDKGMTLSGQKDTIEIVSVVSTLSVGGTLTGSGQLVKRGAGKLYLLNNSNTYTGGTVIEAGEIQLNDPGNYATIRALGTGSVTFKGGTLSLGNTTSGTECPINFVVPEGYSGTLNSDARCNFSGSLTGSGTFNVYNPGTIDRTTYNGNWSMFSGTINATGNRFRLRSSLGYAKATFKLNSGVTMYFDAGSSSSNSEAQSVRIGGLSGGAGSSLFDENWVIGENNINSIYSGVISGYSVTKKGNASLFLYGNNTYTGGTFIDAGNLILLNSTGSGCGTGIVNVNSGGTFGGSGICGGSVAVKSGGTLAPGIAYPYSGLTITKPVTMYDGSKMVILLNNLTLKTDKVITGANSITINGTLEIVNRSGEDFKIGDEFQIINGTNINGQFDQIIPETPGDGLAWDLSQLNQSGIIKVAVANGILGVSVLNESVQVWPNPVNDILNVRSLNDDIISFIEIQTINGNNLFAYNINSSIQQIDLSSLSAGVYLVKVQIGDRIVVLKFNKQ
ncbi:MAG: autotransporter-associated beta strand repeat-containing protein [Marinilabiliaceae bacterium]|nr:autotransporter-associated beta strand repeat-containing protein [Marinilabiliaceae bacterium]